MPAIPQDKVAVEPLVYEIPLLNFSNFYFII